MQGQGMHLKSITMKGFKSFPERTRLDFAPGVSVIVGPNGCGKSNITDAVLWALGEQSPLAVRGQTMQDVIFAGGDGQGARRYAEVEVVIDADGSEASEFAEISVRRRLDRAGDGGYWLNGARCRLSDVTEALADTNLGGEMHSVISQGKVEEIVHSKPRQRRLLIEEAAGLGKHRKRRRRAELKLDRTRDNLDRALDVEREARSHLRPLKRQAQAAETHARLQRQEMELRAPLVADELGRYERELAGASHEAGEARGSRGELEEKLAAVNRRRTEIEERFAERDRERTQLWGRLTQLRATHERLTVRAESLATRQGDLAAGLERRREALGALAAESARAEAEGGDPIELEMHRISDALSAASEALDRARARDGDVVDEITKVREGAERAARAAGRAEGLLGRSRQDSLERRAAAEEELLPQLRTVAENVAQVRDAVGRRVAVLEERMLGTREADDVTEALRACSREEYELQAKLREIAEAVTQAEVRAAHVSERREEAASELARISAALGEELAPAVAEMAETDREQIEVKLERLSRRRESLGPVNPLAEKEYEQAREHVEELEAQREDLESALSELEKLIRDTDKKIRDEFEATLEAAATNFQELVEHLFPGGRGRLRMVDAPGPRSVPPFAGATDAQAPAAQAAEAAAADEQAAEAETDADGESAANDVLAEDDKGVEIEVTPAGKATRRLSLLSGGEKSLVALAFLFAVFLARPSPFYILDEVEAALDDANIDRFLQLVRRFSDRAQFVIVTHQKRTMDAADVLYGVSMGDGGVTKVVSRRLPQDGDQPALRDASADEAAEAA